MADGRDGDRRAMARALALAERGRGSTRPNPLVGCVLVRDGGIVGEGWHERPGGPHAEVAALTAAGDAARGATAYVTLEPCAHTGRTGPCARALQDAGIVRVVHAVDDPNPVARGGAAQLAAAGIAVERGLLAPWAEVQNEAFLHVARTGRSHLTLKLAQTTTGALAVRDRRWVTGAVARRRVHAARARADAVLVGVGTVLADDPRLTVRDAPLRGAAPRAVVVDSVGRTPPSAAVVRPGTIVLVTDDAPPDARARLAQSGADVVEVAADRDGRVDLPSALRSLADRGIQSVLAEPGPRLAEALVAAGVVDRLVLHVAGAAQARLSRPIPTPPSRPTRGADWRWRPVRLGVLGADLEFVAEPALAPDRTAV